MLDEHGHQILIDSHAHFYGCFGLAEFFDAAYSNFKRFADALDPKFGFLAILVITDSRLEAWFDKFRKYASDKYQITSWQNGYWQFDQTDEEDSVYVTNASGDRIYLIAGRQIVTQEDLEVLSIGRQPDIEDHIPIAHAVEKVFESGALAVLPWGPGKWFGTRGRIVAECFEHFGPLGLYVGDNGNRPSLWPFPRLIQKAQKLQIGVLSGSDPLPFASAVKRAGAFGMRLSGPISGERPTEGLIDLLGTPPNELRPYGTLESFGRFIVNQVKMQINKRFVRTP